MKLSASETRLLSQYVNSVDFMHRFVDTLQSESDISRAEYQEGVKKINDSELFLDTLDYFETNKAEIENEFFNELSDNIGLRKAESFCKTITQYWYDGKSKRNSKIVNELKKSILNYLIVEVGEINIPSIVVKSELGDHQSSYSINEIQKILELNHQFLYKYLDKWMDNHPNMPDATRGSTFFRRGIKVETAYPNGFEYKEWDYINSYSLAYTIPEKFCQIEDKNKKISVILNADCDYFNSRVLFFAPFIKGMDIGQLEIGVIPNKKHDYLFYQGEHSGMHEYLIGDHAELYL